MLCLFAFVTHCSFVTSFTIKRKLALSAGKQEFALFKQILPENIMSRDFLFKLSRYCLFEKLFCFCPQLVCLYFDNLFMNQTPSLLVAFLSVPSLAIAQFEPCLLCFRFFYFISQLLPECHVWWMVGCSRTQMCPQGKQVKNKTKKNPKATSETINNRNEKGWKQAIRQTSVSLYVLGRMIIDWQ